MSIGSDHSTVIVTFTLPVKEKQESKNSKSKSEIQHWKKLITKIDMYKKFEAAIGGALEPIFQITDIDISTEDLYNRFKIVTIQITVEVVGRRRPNRFMKCERRWKMPVKVEGMKGSIC